MSVWHAIVLGIVQGLTEFLPISSSAHLIIVPWLFGWDDPGLAFDAAIHLGTLAAAVVYFWREILGMLRAVPRALSRPRALLVANADAPLSEGDRDARLALLIILATIPGGIAGLLGEDAIDRYYHTAGHRDRGIVMIAVMLALVAIVLWIAERLARQERDLWHIRLPDTLAIGMAQAAAVVPGVSRSGSTITTGLFRGLRRADAARYSFLLGIPIIAGAGSKKLVDVIQGGLTHSERDAFIAGIVTSAIVGFIAIWGLLRFLQRYRTTVFIVYRVLMGVFLIAVVLAR